MSTKLGRIFTAPVGPFLRSHAGLGMGIGLLAFIGANTLFSFFHLSLAARLQAAFLGLLVPAILSSWLLDRWNFDPRTGPFKVPFWLWITVGTVALFTRFDRLGSLSNWPISDEGISGYFATMLNEKWDWSPIRGPMQVPASDFWVQALLFKAFGNSLATLWVLPALCSLGCVPLAWLACRKVLGPSLAFLVTTWTAGSFWLTYTGRFAIICPWMVFWEFLTFWALAEYWVAARKDPGTRLIYPLGFLVGSGFYTYLAWPLVACLVTAVVLLGPAQPLRHRLKKTAQLLALAVPLALPLALAFLKDNLPYFHNLWAFGAPHDLRDRFRLPESCLADFFWGAPQPFFHYGPVWGGFLNPIPAALVFLGAIGLARARDQRFSLWLLAAFLLFFSPSLLTNNFEIMRFCTLIPFFILMTALGTQVFLSQLPARKKMAGLLLILGASLAADLYHLFHIYPNDWGKRPWYYEAARSPEFHKAYQILEPLAREKGPGLVLLNSYPDPYDQTLFVATYDFNAAANAKLDPGRASWAAILANAHEEPYLQKLFPEGKWTWLSEGLDRKDGGVILEWVPITASNKALLARWAQADLSLKPLIKLVMDKGVDPDQRQMLGVLAEAYPAFRGDRLLESRYWRIVAFHHAAEGKTGETVEAYRNGVRKGLPMAHLYNEMGLFLFKEKDLAGAQKAFKMAAGSKPDLTNAKTNLQNLLRVRSEEQTKTNN